MRQNIGRLGWRGLDMGSLAVEILSSRGTAVLGAHNGMFRGEFGCAVWLSVAHLFASEDGRWFVAGGSAQGQGAA